VFPYLHVFGIVNLFIIIMNMDLILHHVCLNLAKVYIYIHMVTCYS